MLLRGKEQGLDEETVSYEDLRKMFHFTRGAIVLSDVENSGRVFSGIDALEREMLRKARVGKKSKVRAKEDYVKPKYVKHLETRDPKILAADAAMAEKILR